MCVIKIKAIIICLVSQQKGKMNYISVYGQIVTGNILNNIIE